MSLDYKAGSVVFEKVSKHFGQVTAIDNISFKIEPGQLVTLLGPSGCGKTTTLRMIAGLEHPSAGRILIGDKEVTHLSATDRDVSMVFQSYALFPHMSVAENVAYGLSVSGTRKSEAMEKAQEGLNLVGLAGYGKRLPSELSGGQQQRVAVARALVLEPEVLLLDEPLSNLDAKLRRHVREEIRDLQQQLGLTAVYVTHDQEEALAVSDQIIVMNKSVVAQQGTPRELYEQPSSSFIADFIGDANLLVGELQRTEGEFARVNVGGVDVQVPHREQTQGQVTIAVRPDAVILHKNVEATALNGEVTHASYLGNQIQYTVDSALGELFVIDYRVDQPVAKGSSVALDFNNRGLALVAA